MSLPVSPYLILLWLCFHYSLSAPSFSCSVGRGADGMWDPRLCAEIFSDVTDKRPQEESVVSRFYLSGENIKLHLYRPLAPSSTPSLPMRSPLSSASFSHLGQTPPPLRAAAGGEVVVEPLCRAEPEPGPTEGRGARQRGTAVSNPTGMTHGWSECESQTRH